MAGSKQGTLCAAVAATTLLAAAILAGSPAAVAQRPGRLEPAPAPAHPVTRFVPIFQAPHLITQAPSIRSANRSTDSPRPVAIHRGRREERANVNCLGGAIPSVQQVLAPFPSNGFNFEHQNAVGGNLAIKAAIDPATQLALAQAMRFSCGFASAGGFFLLDGGYESPQVVSEPQEEEAAPQPQIIVVQQPAAQLAAAPNPAPAAAREPVAPLPPPVQFVLVMRDGRQIEAVAFTHNADQVVYITPEGDRRTVALPDLDPDATVRANEDRGTALQLSL